MIGPFALILGTLFVVMAIASFISQGASRFLFMVGAVFFALSSAWQAARLQYRRSYKDTMEQAPEAAQSGRAAR